MAETKDDADDIRKKTVYHAPALEKGLDILELLTAEPGPFTATEIVGRLGRSTGEMFRMIQVLEQRGFLVQHGNAYALSGKLFRMALERPQLQTMLDIATPVMRRLAGETNLACHLTMASTGEVVVVARVEPENHPSISVRVGFRRPLHAMGSGVALYAFQPRETQRDWEAMIRPPLDPADVTQLRDRAIETVRTGYAILVSRYVQEIADIAAPVLSGGRACAALAIAHLKREVPAPHTATLIRQLRAAAGEIAAGLVSGENLA